MAEVKLKVKEETSSAEHQLKKPDIHGAKKKKPGLGEILATEDLGNVGRYLVKEVLIPSLKKLVREMVTNGIDAFLYRNGDAPNGKSSSVPGPSYRKYYDDRRGSRISRTEESRGNYGHANIVVETKSEAKDLLASVDEACDYYDGFITVASVYDLAKLGSEYTDEKYGWTRRMLQEVTIVPYKDKYLVKFPRPIPID